MFKSMFTPSLKTSSVNRNRSTLLPSIFLLMAICSSSHAENEGGFIGLYGGTALSHTADKTGSSFKILAGAHITSELSLEFGYVNMGVASFNDPTAINQEATSSDNISFSDAGHGSIAYGQLGDATIVDPGPDTYDAKSSSTFTGISDFTPEGALFNLSYKFPLIDNSLDFFVKTGFFAWEAKYTSVEITASQTSVTKITNKEKKTSAVNTISGAGFIYYPIPQLSFRAEIESTAISSGVMPRVRMQNISLGANWEF